MTSPSSASYGDGVSGLLATPRRLKFDVDAELIVFGSTKPNARVTLRGEPVKLRADGSFTVRMSLPNQRQVIPVVASSHTALSSERIDWRSSGTPGHGDR